jgi:hypothetical protein
VFISGWYYQPCLTPVLIDVTSRSNTEADEYKEKLKEVEDVCNPIISAAYGKSGGSDSDEDLGDHDEL